MKALFLVFALMSYSFAGEVFYGIEFGTSITSDFENAGGKKRGAYEYVKQISDDNFELLYAKVDSNNKINGIMLYKENENNSAGTILFMNVAQKLKEKYGEFQCEEKVSKDKSGKDKFCSKIYKNYKISYTFWNSMFLPKLLKLKGGVSVAYETYDGNSGLNKL